MATARTSDVLFAVKLYLPSYSSEEGVSGKFDVTYFQDFSF